MAKFGPGAGGGYQGVDGPGGERVALCDEDIKMGVFTREANARLIAAAPDLLAALRAVVASLESIEAFRDTDGNLRIAPNDGGSLCYSGAVLRERLSAARAAIAKAEGGAR